MSHRAAAHACNRDKVAVGADVPLPAKKAWRAPLVITSTAAETEKFSIHSFEGGSYPTTHGPS